MKICSRCELNWISDDEEYCPVCKADLGLEGGITLNLKSEDDEKLCPICQENYIEADEIMCDECRKKKESKKKRINTNKLDEQDEELTNELEDDEDDSFDDEDDSFDDELEDDEDLDND